MLLRLALAPTVTRNEEEVRKAGADVLGARGLRVLTEVGVLAIVGIGSDDFRVKFCAASPALETGVDTLLPPAVLAGAVADLLLARRKFVFGVIGCLA
jgi:hypothetical protein